jgi:hypothetical protein
MRTTFPFVLVLALAITGGFFAQSGFNDIIDGEANVEPLTENVEQAANESPAGTGNFTADRGGTDEGSVVGLIVSGAQDTLNFVQLALLLPITIRELGFPGWFAFTIGPSLQLIVSIGILQFVTGRQFR